MIRVCGLTKYYGLHRALYDLDFEIQRGAVAGLLGLNGAGKTTILKIIAGFLLPSAGSVHIDDIDMVAEPSQLRSAIGFLPEKPPLYDEMGVESFLSYLCTLRGVPAGEVATQVDSAIGKTGLDAVRNAPIGTLSFGFRKRVGIAQAIVHDPKLVILDEPIAGLDPVQIVEMRELVKSLGSDYTVLISSHILTEVEETCDQLLVLDSGEIVGDGTEAELLGRVQGSRSFDLRVLATDPAAVALFLDKLEVIDNWEAGRVEAGAQSYTVHLNDDTPERVVKALVEAGHGLRGLEPSRNPLEGVFLAITGRGGRA